MQVPIVAMLLVGLLFVASGLQLGLYSLLVSCLLLASFTLKNPDFKQEASKEQARNKQQTGCF